MLNSGDVLQERYVIDRQIGGGGMGTVYLGDDNRLVGRRCAIKEMSPAALAPQDRNWSIKAFRREAEILAQLHHPGLTAVTDFFAEHGNWYLVMDFVEGETLAAQLAGAPKGRLPVKEALRIAKQLLDVLAYLHNREPQVVFRDLKPSNVMITAEEQIKLIDFGVARFFKPGKTQDTTFLGTPGYAAPEQYGGMGQSDPRTDIYSLGVVLNQMVTGYDPTTAASPFPIPDPRSLMPSMPSHVAEVISRATQMRPDLRYDSVEEMGRDLFPPTYPLPWQSDASGDEPAYQEEKGTGKGRIFLTAMLVAVLAVGLIGVGYAVSLLLEPSESNTTPALRPTTETPTPTATATATSTPTPTVTPTPTEAVPEPEVVEPVLEPDGIDAVRVAGGSFVQGATRDHIEMVASRICSQYPDSWCRIESFEDELPRSEVDEPNAEIDYIASRDADVATFYIDRYEVTNARYAGCVEAGVCDTPQGQGPNPRHDYFDQAEAADLPVIYVSWEDATDYCHWAGGRLPTAAEWEKAARGTDGRTWPWGDDFPSSRVNYRQPGQTAATEDDTRIRGGDPAAGGAYTDDISPYEVHDMAGNVMEWVSSWYGPGRRELRGGSWNTGSFSTRASSRVGTDPDEAYFDVGFRCAYNELP